MKKSIKLDKWTYIENLAQEAVRRNDMKLLYRITKTVKGDTGPKQNQPLKDVDGKFITVEKDNIQKDGKHISNMFSILADIMEAADDQEMNLDEITQAEVR